MIAYLSGCHEQFQTRQNRPTFRQLNPQRYPAHDTVRYYPVCGLDLARSQGEGLCHGLKPLPSHWLV